MSLNRQIKAYGTVELLKASSCKRIHSELRGGLDETLHWLKNEFHPDPTLLCSQHWIGAVNIIDTPFCTLNIITIKLRYNGGRKVRHCGTASRSDLLWWKKELPL